MRTRRYDSYRGRGRLRTFLKVLIVILLIVLILAVAAFFLLDRSLVVSADGYRLNLPFFQRETEPSSTPLPSDSGGGLPLVVESPTAPQPTPTPELEHMRGVLLPHTALYDGTAAEQVEAAGANAAIFDMKADDGSLGYISRLALAEQAGVSEENPAINAAIRGLNAGELYTVARVSCFRDNAVPYSDNTTSVRSSAGNWRDSAGIRWLSPGRASAREYVAGVCAELAELGFDEIVLDYAGYPTDGELDRIVRNETYDPQDLSGPVEEFYALVAQALEPYPQVRLSIVTSRSVLSGEDDQSGQTLELLEQYAQRVWTALPEDGIYQSAADRLPVVWITDAVLENTDNWAVWTV